MLDIMTRLRSLQRPTLLARAARFGTDDYRRAVHLARILKTDPLPRPAAAVVALLDIEADLNARRLAKQARYSLAQHIDVLIALTGEARLLVATTPRPV